MALVKAVITPEDEADMYTEPWLRFLESQRQAFADGVGDVRPFGALEVDSAFTDLDRDAAGRAWARLWRPDGIPVRLLLQRLGPRDRPG